VAHQRVRRPTEIEAATIKGALHRLRPKLMTVFVVIPSLAPINSARRPLIRRKNGRNIVAVLDQSEEHPAERCPFAEQVCQASPARREK
jgi:hypothetical protein